MLIRSFGVETVFSPAQKAVTWVFGLGVLLILCLGLAASGANAAVLQVETDGVDAGDCQAAACATIPYAIGQSAATDTIEVGAGEYQPTSTILLNKAVTIAGAQAGVDARDRDVPASEETVILGWGANQPVIRMSVPGATVDGVTVSKSEHAGIQGLNTASGYEIRNSILTDNDHGIDIETTATGVVPSVIERNLFDSNNRPGLQSGIYGDSAGDQVTIRDNHFTGHTNVPINISGPTTIQQDLTISGNTFEDERHLLLLGADGVELTDNTFTDGRSAAISVQGGVHDLSISGNAIEGAVNAGILFVNRYGAGVNGTTSITDNSISGVTTGTGVPDVGGAAIAIVAETPELPGYTGDMTVSRNRLVGNAGDGIRNDVDAANVDAPDNWWGCNAGPGGPGCAATSGAVDSSPNVVLSVESSAARVVAGTPVAVAASVDTNSAGEPVDLPVLEGREISFAASSGSIAPSVGTIAAGQVAAGYSSATPVGASSLSAEFDGQSVSADIFVGATPSISSSSVSGTGIVAEPLTCASAGVTGTPAPNETMAWLRAGSVISGQAGGTYTPAAGDIGSQITCRVTVSNEFGSGSADSAPVTIADRPKPPEPKPPVIRPKKGQVRVPNSGKVAVAVIRCPEGTCRVKTPKRVRVKIRGKVYLARVKAPNRVAQGKSAKIRVILPKAARRAIRGTRTRVRVKIVITSNKGERTTVNRATTLKGKKKR